MVPASLRSDWISKIIETNKYRLIGKHCFPQHPFKVLITNIHQAKFKRIHKRKICLFNIKPLCAEWPMGIADKYANAKYLYINFFFLFFCFFFCLCLINLFGRCVDVPLQSYIRVYQRTEFIRKRCDAWPAYATTSSTLISWYCGRNGEKVIAAFLHSPRVFVILSLFHLLFRCCLQAAAIIRQWPIWLCCECVRMRICPHRLADYLAVSVCHPVCYVRLHDCRMTDGYDGRESEQSQNNQAHFICCWSSFGCEQAITPTTENSRFGGSVREPEHHLSASVAAKSRQDVRRRRCRTFTTPSSHTEQWM